MWGGGGGGGGGGVHAHHTTCVGSLVDLPVTKVGVDGISVRALVGVYLQGSRRSGLPLITPTSHRHPPIGTPG